ncbi:DNA-binding protein [uncultured Thiodictyon sp.]|uniref:DNA-binding protein n=1 Tax=uncultured Thiodictyon sp. TaxID=1846217 RepID=UPI0025F1C8C1|nr:DNA-binding protein [uncultured Thiodictyon sp.]
MSAHGATRQRAFETACTLAAAGRRPTIAAVREGLGGKGSQQAIGAGIDDWLDEAARRFQIPGIPEALRTQVVEVWDQACRLAGEQWDGAKTALEAQVSGLDAQVAAVAGERDAARTEIERLAAEMNSQGITLRETQDALDLAGNTLAARTEALAETAAAMAQAREQGEDQSRQRDHAERVAAASAESLNAAQARIARLQVEQEVATARAELLERAEATARDAAAQTRADFAAAQALAEQLRGSVSERDGQLATLTATVQAEQQSRDADTQHWLSRLAEHQAAVTEARSREAALTEEKKALNLEAQRLRQDLRKVPSGIAGRFASPDSSQTPTTPVNL